MSNEKIIYKPFIAGAIYIRGINGERIKIENRTVLLLDNFVMISDESGDSPELVNVSEVMRITDIKPTERTSQRTQTIRFI